MKGDINMPEINGLSRLPKDVRITHLRQYLDIQDNNSMCVDSLQRAESWAYNKDNRCYELDLRRFTNLAKVKSLLENIKDIKKLKIKGLDNSEKLTLFVNAINSLNDNVRFDNLSQLDLSRNWLYPNGFLSLNKLFLRRTSSLTSLNLALNSIKEAGAIAIANSEYMKNLTSLNLTMNRIGDAGAIAIADSTHMKNLSILTLRNNEITVAGAIAIAKSPHMNNLTLLYIGGNEITVAGAIAFASSPHLNNLNSLYLGSKHIEKEVIQSIRAKIPNVSVRHC
tara:strand:+ start:235 stop:1077 length:843 start_codon:yes stop_codon:yes gene_type:complete